MIKLSLTTLWTYQAIPELLQTLQQKHTKNRDSILFYQVFFFQESSPHVIRTEIYLNYFKTYTHIFFLILQNFPNTLPQTINSSCNKQNKRESKLVNMVRNYEKYSVIWTNSYMASNFQDI